MGSACNQDSDCAAAGLRCLDSPVYGDGGCTPQGKQCQQSCTSNANCGILGSNYGCFLRCGNTGVCIATH